VREGVTEAATRFFFEAPAREIETKTARIPCRRFGAGPALAEFLG
jgi:hypothetical protein